MADDLTAVVVVAVTVDKHIISSSSTSDGSCLGNYKDASKSEDTFTHLKTTIILFFMCFLSYFLRFKGENGK